MERGGSRCSFAFDASNSYILQQVNLHQIFHEPPYPGIYQINGMKNLLHSYFLSLLSW
jgi:hypothetical protein